MDDQQYNNIFIGYVPMPFYRYTGMKQQMGRTERQIIAKPIRKTSLKQFENIIICDGCKIEEALKRCSRCKSVYYCSKECQKLDWIQHKKVCNN